MRFLLAAGGTGGHIYPAIAIARQLIKAGSRPGREIEVVFAGEPDGMEGRVVPDNGFEFHGITAIRFPRKLKAEAFAFPYHLIKSISMSWGLIKSVSPDAVIGTGGFVPVPVLLAADLMRKPTFIHEQNVIFGLGNRLLLRTVKRAFVTFPTTRMERYKKILAMGNPIREVPDISRVEARKRIDWEYDEPLLLVFGGSQGARSINNALLALIEIAGTLPPFGILHVTGQRDAEAIKNRLGGIRIPSNIRYRSVEYMEDLVTAMVAADMVVCRAGASTLAELGAIGRPAILVPFPFSAGGHQLANALAVQDTEGAVLIRDEELSAMKLRDTLRENFFDPECLEVMGKAIRTLGRPDAARNIAKEILKVVEEE